jgi:hypothetical protein
MAVEAVAVDQDGGPRIGPEPQRYSLIEEVLDAADAARISLYPWQRYGLDVGMSVYPDETFMFPEVAWIASRQNGKTEKLVPRIKWALDKGRRVIHTAQNRLLPRKVFERVAVLYPDAKIRFANGQEEIRTKSGGRYMIVAPQRGARGEAADDLIVDELREMEDFDFIAAAAPTLTNSHNPQVIYLSNAGTENSVVLNDLRTRGMAGTDGLAYLEWSADPAYAVDDERGWLQANPSIGHSNLTIARLRSFYDRYREAGELAVFETEHLCRWVKSMLPRLVTDVAWQSAREALEAPRNPAMGVSVHPGGRRASAVISWPQGAGSIGVSVIADVTGDPIDLNRLAADLVPMARDLGVTQVGFDSWTDQHLARHFQNAEAIIGPAFANASERFVRNVETGALHWDRADAISEQLPYASRKQTTGTAWAAHPTDPNRPITAVLAAIRAAWLAANPQVLTPAIY